MALQIEKLIGSLSKPEYLKIILTLVAILIVFRNILYIAMGDIQSLFGYTEQRTIEALFHVEIPMLIMTIMYPVLLAFLNTIHKKVRLESFVFISVIIIHLATCAVAVFLLSDSICGVDCVEGDIKTTAYGALALTVFSVIISLWLYFKVDVFIKSDIKPESETS
jgi:glucan phosphoethanolaminetransferase (alkaline phosphatase superfamily)